MPNFKTLILLSVLGGCISPPSDSLSPRKSKFFDLVTYMQSEAQRLNLNGIKVEKILFVNAESDTIYPPEFNFSTELAIFEKANINKIAWEDQYNIDSTPSFTRYSAIDPSLQVKYLQINKNENGDITSLEIEKSSESPLSSNRQILDYSPASGYKISSTQKIILAEEKKIEIIVNFIQ
ncbi:MAG: hypothetical protein RJA52_17 [Bacteroidota bacterium]|jgi:hypothetical protein